MPISLTLLAGIGLLYIVFGMLSGGRRSKTKTSLGAGSDPAMVKAFRAHANLTEWAPIAVMLIAGMEYLEAPKILVASLAGVYFAARILHSTGILIEGDKPHIFRPIGALGGTIVIAWATIYVALNAGLL
ncbi:MAPEG family protein [Kordiimonas aquimaris]|uniref:MAPEG family protein n=1 Tax=Kordiimonas aquimaris TaxID=707591 RepID=UPI0021D2169C|nr:MAPEG family protein [Kordiimonas aquimaris]